jgi:peptide/nickel transport system permease protein
MLPFVARRLLVAIPILLVASFLVFGLITASGDPLENLRLRPGVSPEIVHQQEVALGLDKPFVERYWDWITKFVHGDMGKDIKSREVQPQLTSALSVTLRLVFAAQLLAICLGVTVGIISAVRQYSVFDYTTTGLSFLFYAMPVFWFAVLLKEFGAIKFNNVLEGWGHSRWIATVGSQTVNFEGSFWDRAFDYFGHLILPTITLTIISYAAYSRFQRASMLDTLSSDYVRTAKAKGLTQRRVILKHAFRNALIPVTTLIAIDFGALIGGAIITENVFAWHGMGTLLRDSVVAVDPNVTLAVVMVTAVTVVVFNIIADILYAYLDPRIRLG